MDEHILFDQPTPLLNLARDLERIGRGKGPTTQELICAPTLIEWHLFWRKVPCLIGVGVGHPIVKDGPMITSRLAAIDFNGRWARTMSRWYHLCPSRENNDG